MTKRTLLISIPLVALVLNGLGYVIVSKLRSPPSGAGAQNGASGSSGHSEEPGGVAGGPRTTETGDGKPVDDAYRAKEEQAFVRRAAGLAALEEGNYPKALIDFTEARALLGEKARVDELLRVTEDLRGRPSTGRRNRTGLVAGGGTTGAGTRARPKRIATREEAASEGRQAGTTPAGLLIVTTTPRGLLVQVDDNPIDLTPMRMKVKPGMHRIALLDGDRKLYETTLDVKDGATATLLKDLSSERERASERQLDRSSDRSADRVTDRTGDRSSDRASERFSDRSGDSEAGETAAASRSRQDGSRAPTGALASSASSSPPAAAAQPRGATAPDRPARAVVTPMPISTRDPVPVSTVGTGALSISSPGLYGVVWINGRPRGYPPLEVRDLPAGPVKIEVRVNGVQKRISTVVVKPGLTTAVNIRSQESAP